MILMFCTFMFIIYNIHKMFNTQCIGMVVISLLTTFYIHNSNGLLVTAKKMKHNYRIQMAAYCSFTFNTMKNKKWKKASTDPCIFHYTQYQHTTVSGSSVTPTSEICMIAMLVELDYNVMAHAQETIFVYGRNGRIHILLQQIWGAESSTRY
jgi:hypothetical protein